MACHSVGDPMNKSLSYGLVSLALASCGKAPEQPCGTTRALLSDETANCIDHASLLLSLHLPDGRSIEIPGLGGTLPCDTGPGSGEMTLSTDSAFGPGDVVVISLVVDKPDVFTITPEIAVPTTVTAQEPVSRAVDFFSGESALTIETGANETYQLNCIVH